MSSILVSKPSDLNVAWAQQVLNHHHTDITVSQVIVASVDIGTTTRVRLEVEHNAPTRFPGQWFVKLPSLAWQAKLITALPRLLHTEVRFYNEVEYPAALTVPDFLVGQSQFGKGSVLVLSDLTERGFVPGSPNDTLSTSQARQVIEQLATLHAHYWNKPHLVKRYRWLAGPVRKLEDFLGSALAVPLMKRGLRKASVQVPKELHGHAVHYARNRKQVMRFLQEAPQTLVHHDCHPGNLFWNDTQPGFLDWQLVRFGEGVSDIAYFLATALAPEIRCLHEVELVDYYGQCLKALGVERVDVDGLFERYRAHLIYPFEAMLVTLAIGDMMDLKSNHELIIRTAAAVKDLDAFSALPLSLG